MNSLEHLMSIKKFPLYKVDQKGQVYNPEGKKLKQTINRDGYMMVKLCDNGYEKNCSVHRLVADAFFDGDHKGYDVNHIDGNKQNNNLGNLEIITRGDNLKHAYANNLRKSYLTDEDRKNGASISAELRRKPVRDVDTGKIYSCARECAKDLNCYRSAVTRVCKGELSQHHGHRFEYVEED